MNIGRIEGGKSGGGGDDENEIITDYKRTSFYKGVFEWVVRLGRMSNDVILKDGT